MLQSVVYPTDTVRNRNGNLTHQRWNIYYWATAAIFVSCLYVCVSASLQDMFSFQTPALDRVDHYVLLLVFPLSTSNVLTVWFHIWTFHKLIKDKFCEVTDAQFILYLMLIEVGAANVGTTLFQKKYWGQCCIWPWWRYHIHICLVKQRQSACTDQTTSIKIKSCSFCCELGTYNTKILRYRI